MFEGASLDAGRSTLDPLGLPAVRRTEAPEELVPRRGAPFGGEPFGEEPSRKSKEPEPDSSMDSDSSAASAGSRPPDGESGDCTEPGDRGDPERGEPDRSETERGEPDRGDLAPLCEGERDREREREALPLRDALRLRDSERGQSPDERGGDRLALNLLRPELEDDADTSSGSASASACRSPYSRAALAVLLEAAFPGEGLPAFFPSLLAGEVGSERDIAVGDVGDSREGCPADGSASAASDASEAETDRAATGEACGEAATAGKGGV